VADHAGELIFILLIRRCHRAPVFPNEGMLSGFAPSHDRYA
jgi:hypothetical protein